MPSMPSDDSISAQQAEAVATQKLNQQNFALIDRIIQKDRSALSALYDRYARVVYSVAYRSLGSVEESEEVVMDVFAKIWTTADRYNADKARVDTWILMMARSRVLDRLRSKQRRHKLTEAIVVEDLPTNANDSSADLELADRRTQILTALATLPPEQRQVLELAYYGGWSHREIAEQTGMALGTVKTRIRLGLEKLRSIPQLINFL
jgi:RNA polymerase sigma-70 factor, ECF subfamily